MTSTSFGLRRNMFAGWHPQTVYQFPGVLTLNECTHMLHIMHPHSLILITVIILSDHFHKMHISFPRRLMKYHPSAVLFFHTNPSPFVVMFPT